MYRHTILLGGPQYPIRSREEGLVTPGRHTDHHEKLEFDILTVVIAETEKLKKQT